MVRPLAERLRADGLRVWFEEWECPSPAGAGEGGRRPGEGRGAERIPAKIEAGLEPSRVVSLAHRMGEGARRAGEGRAANAFGSDWAQWEAGTWGRGNLPFRAPLNQERRFLPLRLDDAPIKGSLAQFLYINWRPADREKHWLKAWMIIAHARHQDRRSGVAAGLPERASTVTAARGIDVRPNSDTIAP